MTRAGNVHLGQRRDQHVRRVVSAAKSNGWKLPTSILPTANITAMAASAAGKFYTAAPGTDPLFEDAS